MLVALFLAGCPRYGVVDDGTSVSYGPSHDGALINATRLPARGDGYVIPRQWAARGLNFGTDELVAVLIHTGRRLSARDPHTVMRVADLSPRPGGPSAWHRSHQTGRDADLLFFARDEQGNPVNLEAMVQFGPDGTAIVSERGAERTLHFDVDRNWLLVRTLIENPIAEVQYLFVYEPLKQMLLDRARAMGEPAELILEASYILHQPGDSLPHDDHFHLRIYCEETDRSMGCHDRGALRWTKKTNKYGRERGARAAGPEVARAALPTPMPAMMVLGVFPFLP